MSDYMDRTVLKIARTYTENELIQYFLKNKKKLLHEVGILKSERDEAIYFLEKALKLEESHKNRFLQLKYFITLNREKKKLLKEVKRLREDNLKLIAKLAVLQKTES